MRRRHSSHEWLRIASHIMVGYDRYANLKWFYREQKYNQSLQRSDRHFFFLATTMPQGIGEPIILCPETPMESMPSAKLNGCGLSTKGKIIPPSARVSVKIIIFALNAQFAN